MEVAGVVAATTMNVPPVEGVVPGLIRLRGPQNRSHRNPNPNLMFQKSAKRLQLIRRLPIRPLIRPLAMKHSQRATASQLRPDP